MVDYVSRSLRNFKPLANCRLKKCDQCLLRICSNRVFAYYMHGIYMHRTAWLSPVNGSTGFCIRDAQMGLRGLCFQRLLSPKNVVLEQKGVS